MGCDYRMEIKSQIKSGKYASCIFIGLVCFAVVMGILFFPMGSKSTTQSDILDHATVSSICELATLRNYYHNVARYEEELSEGVKKATDILLWPFEQFIKPGYKQLWIEYSGIVEMGIDVNSVDIRQDNKYGVFDIYIPDAKVLNVYADDDSFSKPITETGWFASITTKDRVKTYSMAQSAMRKEAENDQALLERAKHNAKTLLEQYIVNMGKEMGVNYTIQWSDEPLLP